jgi:hypothetical protein
LQFSGVGFECPMFGVWGIQPRGTVGGGSREEFKESGHIFKGRVMCIREGGGKG